MSKKFVISYSSGKDSTLALYRMIKDGYEPLKLLVTMDNKSHISWFHGVTKNILEKVSDSLDIPLMIVECKGEEYEKAFEEALNKAKEEGAEACVFGDIDLEEHRLWCTTRCNNVGLEAIFPLWQEDREKLTYEFIDSGFKTIIKKVKLEFLNEDFLGEVLTKELVQKIKETGADPCGENGEYHTFVYDGPIYKFKIDFQPNGKTLNEHYGYLDIK
jgi:uncharacterized protein (TIGR00290 family)